MQYMENKRATNDIDRAELINSNSNSNSFKVLWEGSSWNKLEKSRGKYTERTNSFIGSRERAASSLDVKGAIVIVDPFSTGAHLAAAVCAAGYRCARVFSIWDR
jgi:hypothetical protein